MSNLSMNRKFLFLVFLFSICPIVNAGVIQDVLSGPGEIQAGEKLYIRFRLSQPASVKITIIDSDMIPTKIFALSHLDSGMHQIEWNATDENGKTVPPEAYAWRIEAKTSSGLETWEPANLYSRPMEHIENYEWNQPTGMLVYRISVPMRIWVRLGVRLGATLRCLADGEPRPAGLIEESWNGLDESGQINLPARDDWVASIFGYRLPQPCVIVSGTGPLPSPHLDDSFLSRINPPIGISDPWWHRRRAFALIDRVKPRLHIEQYDRGTFAASLVIPEKFQKDGSAILQRMLADRVRLKWFIDGFCAAEEVDAIMPSMLILFPDQIPKDGKPHFITANLVGMMHQVAIDSMWINSGE